MIVHSLALERGRTLHQYRGRASNQYLVEDRDAGSTFLIDCGMPSDAPGLVRALEGMPPLKRVVCTHFHVDHVSGCLQLKRRFTSAQSWLHRAAEPLVSGKTVVPLPGLRAVREVLLPCMRESGYRLSIRDLFNGGLYATPFKKGFPCDRLRFFTEKDEVLPGFTVIPTPGHRPDHTSYLHANSGALVCGDFIIVIDGQARLNPFWSNASDQRESFERIKALAGVTSLWPGHGAVCPAKDVLED